MSVAVEVSHASVEAVVAAVAQKEMKCRRVWQHEEWLRAASGDAEEDTLCFLSHRLTSLWRRRGGAQDGRRGSAWQEGLGKAAEAGGAQDGDGREAGGEELLLAATSSRCAHSGRKRGATLSVRA